MTTQRSVFDFLRSRGEEFVNQVTNELMSNERFIQAMRTAMRGKEWVDQAVARALKTMNVPTRTEFKRAVARIDALEQELADVRRQAAGAERAARAAEPKKARTAAARKKSPRKKTARKKTSRAAGPATSTEAGSQPAE